MYLCTIERLSHPLQGVHAKVSSVAFACFSSAEREGIVGTQYCSVQSSWTLHYHLLLPPTWQLNLHSLRQTSSPTLPSLTLLRWYLSPILHFPILQFLGWQWRGIVKDSEGQWGDREGESERDSEGVEQHTIPHKLSHRWNCGHNHHLVPANRGQWEFNWPFGRPSCCNDYI